MSPIFLTDPYAREAIDAGDPNIAGRWGRKPGAIESFIKGALSKAGVDVPEVSPSVMASLNGTEDRLCARRLFKPMYESFAKRKRGTWKVEGRKKTEQ